MLPTLAEVRATPEVAPFVDALRALGHPDPEAGRPARAEDIARFVERVGRPLPRLYLAYLRRFGEGGPVPLAIGDGRPGLSGLLAYYERPWEPIAEDVVIIAAPSITSPTALLYGGGDEPAVGHPGEEASAPSFAHHLYRQGWVSSLRPNEAQLTVADARAGALAALAEAVGFERLWFSGGDGHCLDGGGAHLYIRQEGVGARVFVLSRLERERDRWARWLERRVGARRL